MVAGVPKADELYAAGRITGCFGIKGYLRIEPASSLPGRMRKLNEVFIGPSPEEIIRTRVEEVIEREGQVLLKLEGIDDRTAAEGRQGEQLFVTREELAVLPGGTYFIHDIVGCEVVSEDDGRSLGLVTDVYKLPAQDVWVVGQGSAEYLVPAVKEFIRSVNIAERRIVVHVIEGLFTE